jgi:hypothetical protein
MPFSVSSALADLLIEGMILAEQDVPAGELAGIPPRAYLRTAEKPVRADAA